MTFNQVIELDTVNFIEWIVTSFIAEIPAEIVTVEDANQASRIMAECCNNYVYLNELFCYLKAIAREEKRNGNKEKAEDYVDKRDIAEKLARTVKQQYDTLSRMITIRSDNLTELHMTDNKTGV